MATSLQVLQWAAMPDDPLNTVPISHSPSPPPASKTLTVASIPSTPQSEAHLRADPGALLEEVLRLQREINVAMGQLLTTRATMDSDQRRLVSNTETALHQNEGKTAKAIKEAKACCTATILDTEAMSAAAIREAETACADHAHTLEQSHRESMQDIVCEAIEKEGWDHQSFLDVCGVALQACPPEAHEVLMYPLQLLTGNMSLAALLVTTPQPATAIGKPVPTTPPLTMSETPAPPMATKQWHHSSNREVASPRSGEEEAAVSDMTPEEWSHHRQKDGRPLAKLLKESHCEAFEKDSDLVCTTRQNYFQMHHPEFNHVGSHDLPHTFWEMATSTGLLDCDIHKAPDVWTGQKDLWATYQVAKSSPKDICFFWVVSPTELPKITGLKGIHSPEALKQQAGLSFCPWCGKVGQNEGMVVNHLRTSHHHLGLICSQCLEYFMASVNMMCYDMQLCQSAPTCGDNDDDHEEDSDVKNGKDDDNFMFT